MLKRISYGGWVTLSFLMTPINIALCTIVDSIPLKVMAISYTAIHGLYSFIYAVFILGENRFLKELPYTESRKFLKSEYNLNIKRIAELQKENEELRKTVL